LTDFSPEIFDEYTRRQYVAKAPHRNPYGVAEEPTKFADFDIFTKVRIYQLFNLRENQLLTEEQTDQGLTTADTMDHGESRPPQRENGRTKG
jgi:hypothetical protein